MYIKMKQFLLEPNKVRHLRNSSPRWEKVYKYAKLMEQGVEFPPVHVYRDKFGNLTYNDGRHRVMAAKLTGLPLKVRGKV